MLLLAAMTASAEPLPVTGPFVRELAPGLRVAAYEPPPVPDEDFSDPDPEAVRDTDRRLFVVTIDPARYELVYLSKLDPALQTGSLSADEWAKRHALQVAWNPGMFEPGGAGTGYTRSPALTSQPKVRRNGMYRAWFVAEPGAAVLDQVPVRGEGLYGALSEQPAAFVQQLSGYGLVSQSLALMREGRAVYPSRDKQWSELAYGVDDQGRAVIVFSRYPYEMRELGRRLEALKLGIVGLLHGEGGPEASLVVRVDGVELLRAGSYETGFFDDSNQRLWPLPAVMGARPR
jgi:hypothetical protein